MAEERQIYERGTLYEEVWAEPVQVVATRYGVSGVALAKTCRRMGVPVPGRGYWAKVRAGEKQERPPLLPRQPGQPERAPIHRVAHAAPPPWAEALDQEPPAEAAQPVVVSPTLEDPHRLVVLASRYLTKAHPSAGLVSVSRKSCLDIRVAPGSVDRALRIFDALIKSVEKAGLKVEVVALEEPEPLRLYGYRYHEAEPRPPVRVTRVVVDDEAIHVCLAEEVRRVEVPQPHTSPKGESAWRPRVYEHQPTGRLRLELTNAADLGVRIRWQDGARQRLEDCLGQFISELGRTALAFKLKRKDAEERARAAYEAELRRQEEARRRYEEEERQRQETRLRDEFDAEVARWRRARDIREYVRAALASLKESDPDSESSQARRERLRWALEYADTIDPLTMDGGGSGR